MLLYLCLVDSVKLMRKDKPPMTLAEVFNLCQDIELRHAKTIRNAVPSAGEC